MTLNARPLGRSEGRSEKFSHLKISPTMTHVCVSRRKVLKVIFSPFYFPHSLRPLTQVDDAFYASDASERELSSLHNLVQDF